MLIDLHAHTLPRSSCSSIWPAELVKQLKQLGIDGVCLTEHNEAWPKDLVDSLGEEHQFLVLRGMEVSTNVGHVLAFGLDSYVSGIWDIKRLRQVVDSVGGVMILAHPLRDSLDRIRHEDYRIFFDAIEVLNGTESTQRNATVLALSKQLGLRGVGGSDSHTLREVGTCATVFDDEIRSERDLIEALKANGYKAWQLR